MVKPLYLLSDSQLFFLPDIAGGGLAGRIRAELPESGVKAAYIGASNDDQPEFYELFVAAMELMGITRCRMVPASCSGEDRAFMEEAGLLLLAGGDVERGWTVFEQCGFKELISRKRYDGTVMVGVSAGTVQLGLGALSRAPQPRKIEMFGFAPFYLAAHEEKNEWWDLRALITLSPAGTRGIGIPAGGGAVYAPDGTLEPLRKPLTELVKEDDQVRETLLFPLETAAGS